MIQPELLPKDWGLAGCFGIYHTENCSCFKKEKDFFAGTREEKFKQIAQYKNYAIPFAGIVMLNVADLGMYIDLINPYAEKLLGQDKELVMGEEIRKVWPGLKDASISAFREVFKTGEPLHLDNLFYWDENHSGCRELHMYKFGERKLIGMYRVVPCKINWVDNMAEKVI